VRRSEKEARASPARMRESRTLGAAELSVNAGRERGNVWRRHDEFSQALQRIASLTPTHPRAAAVGSRMGGPAAVWFAEAGRPGQRKRQNTMATIEPRLAALCACREEGLPPAPRPGDGHE